MSDLIDRHAAIDVFGDIHPLDYNAQAHLERIKHLPSAQSGPPRGRWKLIRYTRRHRVYSYSICGTIHAIHTNYCPDCGADMRIGGAE